MPTPSDAGGGFEDARQNRGGTGGADAAEKTTYVTGSGTDPDAKPKGDVIAKVPSGSGPNIGAWAVGIIVLVIALVYAVGIFR